ncbi:F-box/LRR-repeat protein 21-like [Babylonia areolata]|uniref:F-box/LRR-repeat protein 21-like n=1 Tax=Babylonia areolata TaxID=304850 RepID=UPI003FD1BBE6
MAESCSGHTAADSGQTTHDGPDFSSLPDGVLVHLFKMLPVADRGALASTCSRLSAFMHCPSVWTDVTICLYISPRYYFYNYLKMSSLSDRDEMMIRKYGQYFQRMKLVTDCVFLDRKTFDMVRDFSERRVIKTLLLYMDGYISNTLGRLPNTPVGPQRPHLVAELIHTLSPDTRIIARVPSDYYDTKGNMLTFYTSSKSEVFRSLVKRLELPRTLASEKVLVKMNHRLPSAPTAFLVSQFPALQELQVSLGNATDALLFELADTSRRWCPLRSLVLKHLDWEWKSNAETSDFPQLSSAAWKKVSSASPSLTVICKFIIRYTPLLSSVIKPETPLVKLKVRCYSRCLQVRELSKLCREHSSTLEDLNLSLLVQDVRVEEELVNTVKACPKLQHLTCDMYIGSQLVRDLATDNCRQWRTLRFSASRYMPQKKSGRR